MASGSSDILIAVLGVTGAGKTTFVSKCTGNSDLVIGHGVESCALFPKKSTYSQTHQAS